jgi:hypothetical protein
MRVFLRNVAPATRVQADILDAAGSVVGSAEASTAAGDTALTLRTHVRQPRPGRPKPPASTGCAPVC